MRLPFLFLLFSLHFCHFLLACSGHFGFGTWNGVGYGAGSDHHNRGSLTRFWINIKIIRPGWSTPRVTFFFFFFFFFFCCNLCTVIWFLYRFRA